MADRLVFNYVGGVEQGRTRTTRTTRTGRRRSSPRSRSPTSRSCSSGTRWAPPDGTSASALDIRCSVHRDVSRRLSRGVWLFSLVRAIKDTTHPPERSKWSGQLYWTDQPPAATKSSSGPGGKNVSTHKKPHKMCTCYSSKRIWQL